MNAVDLASLLCSRLCHDLMSPVGALSNGLELMADEDDPQMREHVMALLADSARTTSAKLKFFRLAFGAAGGYAAEVDTAEAEAVVRGLFEADGKIAVDWQVGEARLPKSVVKLLLNLALIAGDALVRGGRLAVGAERRGAEIELVIGADGPRVIVDPSLRATLTLGAGEEPVEARAAGAWLAHALAAEGGGTIRLSDAADDHLLIGATVRTQALR
jgi:histidine phosphotransferase ChpT